MLSTKAVILGVLVICTLCTNYMGFASPVFASASSTKSQETTGKEVGTPVPVPKKDDLAVGNVTSIIPAGSSTVAPIKKAAAPATTYNKSHINNTEKLKRGLANFMNHLNPAHYFVPQDTTKGSPAGSQAIINDAGAEAVIKGPTRLTRPLGSPLRWGR